MDQRRDPKTRLQELLAALRMALSEGKREALTGPLATRTYVAIVTSAAQVQGYVEALDAAGISAGPDLTAEALSLMEDGFVIRMLREGPSG